MQVSELADPGDRLAAFTLTKQGNTLLEALHSNLLTASPVGGMGRCASASHPDILSYHLSHPFTLSFTALLNTPLVPPQPFISGHAICLSDESGFWGGRKKKGIG